MQPSAYIKTLKGFTLIELVIVVAAVVLIGFTILMLMGRDTLITNEGTTYKLSLPDSKPTEVEGKQFLVSEKTGIVATAAPSSNESDCGSRGAKIADTVELFGKKVSVCQNTQSPAWIYTANFEYNGSWHMVTVFSNDKTKPVEMTQALEAIKSVRIK